MRSTYSHAQKMRAALAYGYANSFNRGSEKWEIVSGSAHCAEGKILVPDPERYKGNPTNSPLLKNFMIALRKRKVRR